MKTFEICCLRVKARSGWHADNEYWKIGSWIDFEDNCYAGSVPECIDSHLQAAYMTWRTAVREKVATEKQYPGIELEIVQFFAEDS